MNCKYQSHIEDYCVSKSAKDLCNKTVCQAWDELVRP